MTTTPPRPIYDLHCDLLAYLHGRPQATPFDPGPGCSLPQLAAGGVAFQTLALFGPTRDGSERVGPAQAQLFRRLVAEQAERVVRWIDVPGPVERGAPRVDADGRIMVVAAIENASLFSAEGEPLDAGLRRLDEIEAAVGRLLYVSLTWHDENRFAGGNLSPAGLAADGRVLVERLAEKGIAVDLSHTSPATARDVVELVEARRLPVRLLASHSNFAACFEHNRNLPDDVAREIIRRGGLIGLNFLRTFLGDGPHAFVEHLAHGLELGGGKSLAMGADFFDVDGIAPELRAQWAPDGFFFAGYEDASCYPRLLELLHDDGSFPAGWLDDLANGNVRRFLADQAPPASAGDEAAR